MSWLLLLTSNTADPYKLFFISQEEVFTETEAEDYRFVNKLQSLQIKKSRDCKRLSDPGIRSLLLLSCSKGHCVSCHCPEKIYISPAMEKFVFQHGKVQWCFQSCYESWVGNMGTVQIYGRCSATIVMKTTQGARVFPFSATVFRKPFRAYHQPGVTEPQSQTSEAAESITVSSSSLM